MPSYTIRPGDTLSSLARRYGTSVSELMQTNGIPDPNNLVAGNKLVIPGPENVLNYDRTLSGTSANDTISGGRGNDIIDGKGGNDKLTGGLGADKLTGGTGSDTFIFNTVMESTLSAKDTILDFKASQGDKINLSAIDANSNASGNQSFKFIGEKSFTGVAGELRYVQNDKSTNIYGDVDGDKKVDFAVALISLIDLKAGDFLL
jgi:Ca2+-binding RTX toxin-like protein